jgi:hypothetical protein
MTSEKIRAGMLPPVTCATPLTPRIGTSPSAWPSQTAPASVGVVPTNHASVWLEVVPVLPATSQPGTRAAWPVPRSTASRSTSAVT